MAKTTIKDVASAAGVSTMTVSRVINRRQDVSAETRQRVLEVVEALDYAPNSAARSLSQGRSNTIGVVTSHIEHYGPSRTLVGIEQQSNALGFSLLLSLIYDPEHADGPAIIRNMLANQVSGIVWAAAAMGHYRAAIYDFVRTTSTPVIFMDGEPIPGISALAADNEEGGRQMTRHLLSQGYRRVAIITGPLSWTSARARYAGWLETMREAGVTDIDNLYVEGDWTPASGAAGLTQLLRQSPDIDAVFACNDEMALGALQAATSAGRSVPHDLGIAGYDNIPGAAYFNPPLTSVKQDLASNGRRAVEMLDEMQNAHLRGERPEPGIEWVQPHLIVRRSTVRNGGAPD